MILPPSVEHVMVSQLAKLPLWGYPTDAFRVAKSSSVTSHLYTLVASPYPQYTAIVLLTVVVLFRLSEKCE